MKIKSIQMKNFRRFTDLTIEALPKTASLVVMIGPNGSGKSSVFDALLKVKNVKGMVRFCLRMLSGHTKRKKPNFQKMGTEISPKSKVFCPICLLLSGIGGDNYTTHPKIKRKS